MAFSCGGGTYFMCRECGDCTKEHNKTIDDSIDETEAIGI
jgi:hypothetical protein